jgi:hypothetical protein
MALAARGYARNTGPKSELDILELLTRCRVDMEELRRRAGGYGLGRQLSQVLARVQE